MLSTSIAGIQLKTCIFNASGPRTGSTEALKKIAQSDAGAVLSKSATLKSQKGNPLPRTWKNEGVASLNSEGLPNYGIEYYTSDDAVAASAEKPYFVSLSGKTLEDNLAMLEIVSKIKGVDAIELNVACPNVIGHPIIGYDFDQFQDVLESLARHPDVRKKPLGLKLPPYLDFQHFKKVAEMINKCNFVRYVACINTMGNALVVDAESEQPLIRPKGGFGGLSGPSVKYTALANVKKLRELLRSDIDVSDLASYTHSNLQNITLRYRFPPGSGRDAFEMILCGASAVQVGTCHWIEGPKCFERIASELRNMMQIKGYAHIEEFRGKLKPWAKERVIRRKKQKKNNVVDNTSGKSFLRDASFIFLAFALLVNAMARLGFLDGYKQ